MKRKLDLSAFKVESFETSSRVRPGSVFPQTILPGTMECPTQYYNCTNEEGCTNVCGSELEATCDPTCNPPNTQICDTTWMATCDPATMVESCWGETSDCDC